MEYVRQLERKILQWTKELPHLPSVAQKWLGQNIWWIILVIVILSSLGFLISLLTLLGGVAAVTLFAPAIGAVALVAGLIGLAFSAVQIILMAMAIKPLQTRQKQGWTLLFIAWLVSGVAVVAAAILSFNPFNFIVYLIFGAVFFAIAGYFLFEIHGQFAPLHKSKGVKKTNTRTP